MKKLLFVVATLLFATSCELIGRIEDWLSPSPAEQELYISLEQEGEPSRVQLDNVGKTVWTAEDKVSVFYNIVVTPAGAMPAKRARAAECSTISSMSRMAKPLKISFSSIRMQRAIHSRLPTSASM